MDSMPSSVFHQLPQQALKPLDFEFEMEYLNPFFILITKIMEGRHLIGEESITT